MRIFSVTLFLIVAVASAPLRGDVAVNFTNLNTTSGFYDGFNGIEIKIAGFTGSDNVVGNSLTSISGTFTIEGTGFISVPGDSSGNTGKTGNDFSKYISNALGGDNGTSAPPDSFVNFDSLARSVSPVSPARSPDAQSTTSLTASWFTTSADLVAGDELAAIYVTPGSGITFSGQYNTLQVQGGTLNFSSPVPEPATLGLLPLAAMSLLSRRRRRA